jgi:integrase
VIVALHQDCHQISSIYVLVSGREARLCNFDRSKQKDLADRYRGVTQQMPQPAKGARLFLRKRKGRSTVYVIKDVGVEISTCTDDSRQAEIKLAAYIEQKGRSDSPAQASELTITEVLTIYGEEHAVGVAAPERQGYAMAALLPFWGNLTADAVKGATCRRYGSYRGKAPATVRRELNVLQAALNYCMKEGYLITAPVVTMPPTPETTQRAMTRDEVAILLRTARRRGQKHVAHFIIISIYTGTRKAAALNLRLSGPATHGGWFDLNEGLLYRRGRAERVTNKRRTPSKIPRQLLAHARRWEAMGQTWAVEFRGNRVMDLKTAWGKVVLQSGLDWRPTPHSLKHTAITWAIQGGASIPDAAAYFSTSTETIERTYWHLSPHFQSGALAAIEGNQGRNRGG